MRNDVIIEKVGKCVICERITCTATTMTMMMIAIIIITIIIVLIFIDINVINYIDFKKL